MSHGSIRIKDDSIELREEEYTFSAFRKGDFIVECRDARGGDINFGVVMKVDTNPEVLDIIFPTGRYYSFASHCQHYRDWLKDNGF